MSTLRDIPEGLNEAAIRKAWAHGANVCRQHDEASGGPKAQAVAPSDAKEPQIQGIIAVLEVIDAARKKGKR